MKLVFRFEDYSKLSMDWEKRRLLIKSYPGNIVILGTGLGTNDKFGGCGLYINNDKFKWTKSKAYASVDGGIAIVKISRETKELDFVEHEYLEARVEKDTATGFWIYVRKSPPGVKVKHDFDVMIPLSNPFDIY